MLPLAEREGFDLVKYLSYCLLILLCALHVQVTSWDSAEATQVASALTWED